MIRFMSYVNLCLCLSSFKLLFSRSYVSTDFDVHRNWMAITYNLPIRDWYFDKTSEWTLDYPPLFAYFEFLLALIAHLLKLDQYLNLTEESRIRSESIVIYQKVTVIITDLIYYYAIYKLCHALEPLIQSSSSSNNNRASSNNAKRDKNIFTNSDKSHASNLDKKPSPPSSPNNLLPVIQEQNLLDAIYRPDSTSCIALLLLFQPGLLLVDHIHFQYNGLLSGLLLLSVANLLRGKYAMGSFWFAILLNFKHIYLYSAPAFGMYLLTSYCMASVKNKNRAVSFLKRTLKLGLVVAAVFGITFSRFANIETIKQILSRLFPFKRGLTHAYWAPNVWSLYNTADKVLSTVFKKPTVVKFDMDSISGVKHTPVTSTSGLVQEYEHQYLPTVKPSVTFVLVAIFTLPLIIKFMLKINRPTRRLFLMAITLATFTSFMFGWHVHEKAIIVVILPLIPISFIDLNLGQLFLRLSLAGTYSLFPLLFEPAEYLTKLTLLLTYYCYSKSLVGSIKQQQSICRTETNCERGFLGRLMLKLYNLFDKSFVLAIILVEIYVTLIHGNLNFIGLMAKLNKYDFMPLMLTSSLSALGITFSYLELYYYFIFCLDDEAAEAAALTAC